MEPDLGRRVPGDHSAPRPRGHGLVSCLMVGKGQCSDRPSHGSVLVGVGVADRVSGAERGSRLGTRSGSPGLCCRVAGPSLECAGVIFDGPHPSSEGCTWLGGHLLRSTSRDHRRPSASHWAADSRDPSGVPGRLVVLFAPRAPGTTRAVGGGAGRCSRSCTRRPSLLDRDDPRLVGLMVQSITVTYFAHTRAARCHSNLVD